MWNEPTKERLNSVPRLYETEDVPLKEKLVHLHFFMSGCDWYICETDGKDIMWGFCILNNDYEMAEWDMYLCQNYGLSRSTAGSRSTASLKSCGR